MIRSFLDREGSTCFAEGLLGFDLVDGEVFVGLICPGSFYIRDFFVLVVVDVGLLCEYSCFFGVVFDGGQCFWGLFFGLVLFDDGGGELGVVIVVGEDAWSALRVGSDAWGVEESMCEYVFGVGPGQYFG